MGFMAEELSCGRQQAEGFVLAASLVGCRVWSPAHNRAGRNPWLAQLNWCWVADKCQGLCQPKRRPCETQTAGACCQEDLLSGIRVGLWCPDSCMARTYRVQSSCWTFTEWDGLACPSALLPLPGEAQHNLPLLNVLCPFLLCSSLPHGSYLNPPNVQQRPVRLLLLCFWCCWSWGFPRAVTVHQRQGRHKPC